MNIFKRMANFFKKQTITVLSDSGIQYILNEHDKTAILERDRDSEGEVFIPRSITHNSEEFTITTVLGNSFNGSVDITSIIFSEDSEVTTIGEGAFFYSSIQSITIPHKVSILPKFALSGCYNLQSVHFPENSELREINGYAFSKSNINSIHIPSKVELKADWCIDTKNLNSFSISSKNDRYGEYQGQYIIGKSDTKSDVFDILVFAVRNIEIATIPPFIKIISSSSFDCCANLKKIEFLSSEISIFDDNSFADSSLKYISIPSSVTQINQSAFFNCSELRNVNFECKSKLETIRNFAFFGTKIESFVVPSSVKNIGKSAFENCLVLNKIKFDENSLLEFIDEFAFVRTSISSIEIPPNVKKMCSNDFNQCSDLQIIQISEFSKMESFEIDFINIFDPILMIPQDANIKFITK